MAYITPITDRDIADIAAKNSKAYLNLADWQRIDNNAQEVVSEVLSIFGVSLTIATVATMTTASIPETDDINDLSGNIEVSRSWIATNCPTSPPATNPDFTEVKDDSTSGAYPDYTIINQWENVLDIAYNWLDGLVQIVPIAGVAIAGAGFDQQSDFGA